MNRKILLLISVTVLLITLNILNLYIKSQNELKSEYQTTVKINKIARQITYLKNKYSNKPLKILKPICKIKNTRIICNNLSQSQLRKINYFLKSDIKIKKFSLIRKNNKFDFYAEIIK